MTSPFHLFECFGVELEYMIVARDDLRVLPICDQLMRALCDAYEAEIDMGPLAWSNELVLHVLEFKTNGPAAQLHGLEYTFHEHVRRANQHLARFDACLLPTAMHPTMNPDAETRLWPHEFNAVYQAFNRIFDCRGHGWANLQSTHLNLPFADDLEFGRLHAAIRLLLPILPALAAASPIADSTPSAFADTRMEYYRHNARRLPIVSGRIIPEPVFTPAAYQGNILKQLYTTIAPLDPEGILQHEWLNARGAIARFDRGAVEIRVLDIQECPAADLAILTLITAVLRWLVAETPIDYPHQQAWNTDPLANILLQTIRDAENATITNRDYLAALGCQNTPTARAADLWQHLAQTTLTPDDHARYAPIYDLLFSHGTLATRIRRALGPNPDHPRITDVYRRLQACLENNTPFTP